mgnify:CR=1 FL=1
MQTFPPLSEISNFSRLAVARHHFCHRLSHSVVTAPDVKIICTDRELDEKDVRLVTTYTMQLKKFAVTIHLPVAFV